MRRVQVRLLSLDWLIMLSLDWSELVSNFHLKWDSEDVDRDDKRKAAGQCLAFIQMIDSVLSAIITSPTPATIPLPKIGKFSLLIGRHKFY